MHKETTNFNPFAIYIRTAFDIDGQENKDSLYEETAYKSYH